MLKLSQYADLHGVTYRDTNASRNIEVEALRIFETAQGVACA
jgi:hypothetical protein